MFSWLGFPFSISPAHINENPINDELPVYYVKRLAEEKLNQVRTETEGFVIAADTIVVFNGEILGKPKNSNDAKIMLQKLRGKKHEVMTALAISDTKSHKCLQDTCCSNIQMRFYSDEEITQYIATGDPMDKAGSYAIQRLDFNPAINFQGCYASVMGLPLCHLERNLRKFAGYNSLPMPDICQSHLNYECPIYQRILAGEDIG